MTSLKTAAAMDSQTDFRTDPNWRCDLRSSLVRGLVVLLSLQLLLALALNLRAPGMSAPTAQTPLLVFAPEAVTQIRIAGANGTDSVTLNRLKDRDWTLADLGDFPVVPAKVEQLLAQLSALERPLPIATSAEARKRFKLADDGFERRLTLAGKDGTLATLLIGESPGFRRLFARPANDPAVYDLTLALSDVSDQRDDWLDPGLLHLEQERIARIAGAGWTLVKNGEIWRLEESEQAVDQSVAQKLALRLANLSYRGALGTADDPAYRQQTPRLELTLGLTDGTSRTYRISQAENSEDLVLKDAARPYYLKLSTFDLEGILDLDPATLRVKPAAGEPSSITAQPSSEPGVAPQIP